MFEAPARHSASNRWRRSAGCLLLGAALGMSNAICAQGGNAAAAMEASPGLVARALAYEHGEGVARDQRLAAALYCEAARGGDPEAMFSLGWMYANGRGVAHDDAVAASLFARAAQLGHAQAQRMLDLIGGDQGIVLSCMLPREADRGATRDDQTADPFAELPAEKKKVADVIIRLAPTYTLDPRLALAIVAAESNFEPNARSVKDARGVMQLVAGTAARFSVRNRLDIADNVRGGLSYLRWLLAYYEGQVPLAVAAYNAGEAAVDRYRGIPPYRETRDYVRRVLRFFPSERHPYDPRIVEPSRIVTRSNVPTE